MSTKFTPGPWTAKEWCCHAATTVLSGDIVVAECSGHGRPSSDSIADAHIIAAAPEMYEALKNFDPGPALHFGGHGNGCAICIARAALAKAEGR